MSSRRQFLKQAAACALLPSSTLAVGGCATTAGGGKRPPNILLIMTDDQGYGDLGCTGNTFIKTPNIDRLYSESLRLTQFHVSPVCSPTRSSLMTGRYNYRTGVIDTFQGRSMMRPDEVTLAEMLSAHGYRTGIFGKWHLGDNYPMRAMDKGFQESLVHKGGGICQPSEPRNNSYFDPMLKHNGVDFQGKGYCADIFTDAAMDFIKANTGGPFFAYLATNTPHWPLFVDDKYVAPYLAMGLDEKTAKLYGMCANIDENVGKLLALLKERGLDENTIVIFMTDNGPYFPDKDSTRYNAGLRDAKGSVYEGGIHVPFFVRWPGHLQPGKDIDRVAAHIDVAPTLLEACGISWRGFQSARPLPTDGKSLWPLMTGTPTDWPDRTLYFQWHRGDVPELYNNCAARTQQYKLVKGTELYDLSADPGEQHDIAKDHPDIVAKMRDGYEKWFQDVCSRGFEPPKIVIGTDHENPVVLTRQDWRGAESWHDARSPRTVHVGYWEVDFAQTADYEIKLEFPPLEKDGEVHFEFGDVAVQKPAKKGDTVLVFSPLRIKKQAGRLSGWVTGVEMTNGAEMISVRRCGA